MNLNNITSNSNIASFKYFIISRIMYLDHF